MRGRIGTSMGGSPHNTLGHKERQVFTPSKHNGIHLHQALTFSPAHEDAIQRELERYRAAKEVRQQEDAAFDAEFGTDSPDWECPNCPSGNGQACYCR